MNLLRLEADNWISLARWVGRRPDVAPGAAPFAYHATMLPPILVFLALSLIEVVAVDLLVPWPWPWLRIAFLILGAWGVTFALGMLASVIVHPHVVGPDGLRIRSGRGLDVHLPWDAIGSARRVRRSRDGRSVQLDGTTLHVVASGETTVELTLTRPVAVTLPGDRTAEVTAVRLHADDPAGLVAAVRSRAAAAPVLRPGAAA